MTVLLPKSPQGFCFGVKRAIEMVRQQTKPVAVIGQLVHNPGVIESLEKENIFTVTSPDSAPSNAVLAITAHGATSEIHRKLAGNTIVDTTCPYVVRLQKTAQTLENDGWKVIILGDATHPEILSVTSFLINPTVVSGANEACGIGFFEKIALVSQTTQTHEALEEVAAELKKHCHDFRLADTICPSTKERQEQVVELAKEAGAVVVVGGKTSANTRRLFELARKNNPNAFWIESVMEVDTEFSQKLIRTAKDHPVGVISGASTPVEDFEAVVEAIQSI